MNQSDRQQDDANPDEAAPDTEPAELVTTPAEPENDEESRPEGLPQFVTRLAPLEEQVGGHVITALQHPKTIGVLTTVAADGGGGQQVVSIALDAKRFKQVQALLTSAKKERKRKARCIGFHCHFQDDDADDDQIEADEDAADSDGAADT